MLTNIFTLEKQVMITFIASFLILFMVGGVVYFWMFRKKLVFRQVVIAFIAMFAAWAVSDILKKYFLTERPFIANGQVPLTLTWPFDPSFPSNHASSAFALALSIRKSDKRLFIVYLIFALLVSFGRVLSRVHYFIDVFAGALIGVAVVYILEKMGMERFFKKVLT